MTRGAWIGLCLVAMVGVEAWADEKIQRVVPPSTVIRGMTKVAILEGGGPLSEQLQKASAAAVRSRIGFDQSVSAPEQGTTSQVVDFTMVPSGLSIGMADAVALASQHGAQAVLVAEGAAEQTEWDEYTEQRKSVKMVDGQAVTQEWTVNCARRTIRIDYGMVLYEGDEGREVIRNHGSNFDAASDCDEAGADTLNVPSVSAIYADNVGRLGVWVARHFVPRWDGVKLETQRDAATKDTLQHLKVNAYDLFIADTARLLVDDSYNPIAVLHLGMGMEALGFPEHALTLYRYADRLKSTNVTRNAMASATQRIQELETLAAAWGIRPTSKLPEVATPWIEVATKALSIPVRGAPGVVKGAKNKRVPMLDQPTGSPISQVPGGTDVRVIEEKGGMVLIQLPDGLEGWTDAKNVKS